MLSIEIASKLYFFRFILLNALFLRNFSRYSFLQLFGKRLRESEQKLFLWVRCTHIHWCPSKYHFKIIRYPTVWVRKVFESMWLWLSCVRLLVQPQSSQRWQRQRQRRTKHKKKKYKYARRKENNGSMPWKLKHWNLRHASAHNGYCSLRGSILPINYL